MRDGVVTTDMANFINDNIGVPIYVLTDLCAFEDYNGYGLSTISKIEQDYIYTDDDGETYICSYNEEDMIATMYENITDEEVVELGFDPASMTNNDFDKLYNICEERIESLPWKKCIVIICNS